MYDSVLEKPLSNRITAMARILADHHTTNWNDEVELYLGAIEICDNNEDLLKDTIMMELTLLNLRRFDHYYWIYLRTLRSAMALKIVL